MRTLNLRKTSRSELKEHWGFWPFVSGELFIRSNRNGEVNWDKAPVYTWAEVLKEKQRRPVHFTFDLKEISLQ